MMSQQLYCGWRPFFTTTILLGISLSAVTRIQAADGARHPAASGTASQSSLARDEGSTARFQPQFRRDLATARGVDAGSERAFFDGAAANPAGGTLLLAQKEPKEGGRGRDRERAQPQTRRGGEGRSQPSNPPARQPQPRATQPRTTQPQTTQPRTAQPRQSPARQSQSRPSQSEATQPRQPASRQPEQRQPQLKPEGSRTRSNASGSTSPRGAGRGQPAVRDPRNSNGAGVNVGGPNPATRAKPEIKTGTGRDAVTPDRNGRGETTRETPSRGNSSGTRDRDERLEPGKIRVRERNEATRETKPGDVRPGTRQTPTDRDMPQRGQSEGAREEPSNRPGGDRNPGRGTRDPEGPVRIRDRESTDTSTDTEDPSMENGRPGNSNRPGNNAGDNNRPDRGDRGGAQQKPGSRDTESSRDQDSSAGPSAAKERDNDKPNGRGTGSRPMGDRGNAGRDNNDRETGDRPNSRENNSGRENSGRGDRETGGRETGGRGTSGSRDNPDRPSRDTRLKDGETLSRDLQRRIREDLEKDRKELGGKGSSIPREKVKLPPAATLAARERLQKVSRDSLKIAVPKNGRLDPAIAAKLNVRPAREVLNARVKNGDFRVLAATRSGQRFQLGRQFDFRLQGDLSRRLNLVVNLQQRGGWRHRYFGPISPVYSHRCRSIWYAGPRFYAAYVWYPTWSPWVDWCWWDTCAPIFDPRPVYCQPVVYDPCGPWVAWRFPAWRPLPYVACGSWVDVDPVVIPTGVDVQLLATRFVDPGHPDNDLGARFRVWLRNNSPVDIDRPFNVLLIASTDANAYAGLPEAGIRVHGIRAGETQAVDIRLPSSANVMGQDSQGRRIPFTYLTALVDSHNELGETYEDNNGATLVRGDILPVDPAAFAAEPAVAQPNSVIHIAGEGLGPEPGEALVVIGDQEFQAEILGWFDLGVQIQIPDFELDGATAADIVIVRGDGAAANPLTIEIDPSPMVETLDDLSGPPVPEVPEPPPLPEPY